MQARQQVVDGSQKCGSRLWSRLPGLPGGIATALVVPPDILGAVIGPGRWATKSQCDLFHVYMVAILLAFASVFVEIFIFHFLAFFSCFLQWICYIIDMSSALLRAANNQQR